MTWIEFGRVVSHLRSPVDADAINQFLLVKRLIKYIHRAEVLRRVLHACSQVSVVDHVVDDGTEVIGAMHAPVTQDNRCQQSVLLDCEVAQSETQLLAGDMPIKFFQTEPVAHHQIRCVSQPLLYEGERLRRIGRIRRDDGPIQDGGY